ncbi:MAG: hypothetical protein K1V76_02625 [Candidatus Amulumruptor sp.]
MKHINNTDARLRDLFKSDLAAGPRDPDFTRKVMNRLPDRKPIGWIRKLMTVVYIIAAIIATTLFIHITKGINAETLRDPMMLLTYFGMLATFFTTIALSRSRA